MNKLSRFCFLPLLLLLDWHMLPSNRKRRTLSRFGLPLLGIFMAVVMGFWATTIQAVN
jgi:hypothetical protein